MSYVQGAEVCLWDIKDIAVSIDQRPDLNNVIQVMSYGETEDGREVVARPFFLAGDEHAKKVADTIYKFLEKKIGKAGA